MFDALTVILYSAAGFSVRFGASTPTDYSQTSRSIRALCCRLSRAVT
jgi:hypothetical protein